MPALCELLARVSRLAEDVPEILELDLNPVVVLPPARVVTSLMSESAWVRRRQGRAGQVRRRRQVMSLKPVPSVVVMYQQVGNMRAQSAAVVHPGLTTSEAFRRSNEFGPNALPSAPGIPAWRRFARQFASPLIYLLIVALAFDLGLWLYEREGSWPVEASAIALILLLNAGLGLYQEGRSEAALARVRSLAGTRCWVLRDSTLVSLPTDALVPGDLVHLEAGDRIPADGILVDAHAVMIDESNLTGESVPVDKGDQSEASSGTLLVRGRTALLVTRTGRSSALGHLARMLSNINVRATPLERRVQHLATQIARGVLLIAAVLAIAGIAAEGWERAPETIIFLVALAVAAVPEGLPAVMTVALAIGVERMARRQAVVRRLSAVEALGSVTVIATDKTGTLTENRMEVRSLDVPDQARALRAIVLANDGDLATGAGDPLDLGLLRHASANGLDIARERATHPVTSRRPFDGAWKFMRVTVAAANGTVSYFKGAPEAIFRRCTLSEEDRDSWQQKLTAYGREGFRVLALATGEGNGEVDLTFLGLVLFWVFSARGSDGGRASRSGCGHSRCHAHGRSPFHGIGSRASCRHSRGSST